MLVEQKMELTKLLNQYNKIINTNPNDIRHIKRKNVDLPEREDISKSSDEEDIFYSKNLKSEIKSKKISKKKDNNKTFHEVLTNEKQNEIKAAKFITNIKKIKKRIFYK